MNNALSQYIELYKENAALIDANSAPVLNSLRATALHALDGAHLPTRRTEGYEKTSIDDMFAPDFGVNITRVNIPVDVANSFRCDVPNLSTLLGFVLNDSFHPTSKLNSKLPEGVFFTSLRQAAIEQPELVGRYYGSLAPLGDTSVALNTLLAQDGVFIYVPKNVRVERPLQLVNIFSAPVPMLAFRRVLIVLEEGAEMQLIVCDHTQEQNTDFLASQIVEVIVKENASFDACSIEESSARTGRYSKLYVSQHASSRVTYNSTTLTCGTTRNEFTIDLLGENCETHLAGMAIGSEKMHIDNDSAINHRAPHCKSNQLFKYVLDEEATGAFEGSILVTPEAQYTEAYQSNRNILASTSARMHCKPQLEIYNDEVKCSHGATTGQLDTDALFYMRTRGIPEAEARTMLMQAFMIDVIETMHIAGLQERLRHLVERRFAGTLGNCSACKEKC